MTDPRKMTKIYKNLPWMYSLLKDEPSGTYYLEVVCGTIGWYEVYLRLTEAEVAAFLPAVAAGQPDALTALAQSAESPMIRDELTRHADAVRARLGAK